MGSVIASAAFVQVPSASATVPTGSIDVLEPAHGGVRIAGWALDPDTAASIYVHVYVDNVIQTVQPAAGYRPDLTPHGKGPYHGFDFVVPLPAGTLCVYAINDGAGGNPSIGCRGLSPGALPVGDIDLLVSSPLSIRVIGWATDPDTSQAISVQIYRDGSYAASVPADTARPDVAIRFGWGTEHGYEATFGSGASTVCVYAVSYGPGGNPLLGCRPVMS